MQGWSKLIPAIEADASYFADNRPGYGNSAPETTPCCGSRVVEELRAALLSEGGNRFSGPDGINARRQIESLQCSRADDQSSEPGAYFLPEIEFHSIVSLKGSTAEGKFAAVAVLRRTKSTRTIGCESTPTTGGVLASQRDVLRRPSFGGQLKVIEAILDSG